MVGLDYLSRRQLYNLNSFQSAFGYTWQANKYIFHEIHPVSINYVNLSNTSSEFDDILAENDFLRRSFDQEFIAGLTYSFTYNGLNNKKIQNPFFIRTDFDIAGNTIDALFGDSGNTTRLLDLEYAQYAKSDVDLRIHLNFRTGHQLITRLFGGIGIPYGNSAIMPFSKQYFSGGPYSVRAFRIRSLGPGTYSPSEEDEGSFFDRTGDIRLEGNLEYRFPLISVLKGAVFMDAGNVWLLNENEDLSGGKFSSDFINELGIGLGLGLRVDVQNFVIRGDLAAPISDPTLPSGERFSIVPGRPIFNFAIGYPF